MSTEETIAALDAGEIRVAEKRDGAWVVNEEAKQAILDYFRIRRMEPVEVGPFEYHDKIPLKRGYAAKGVRVVPPATIRYGAYVSPGAVVMPSYVNIGAWIGPGHDGRHLGDRRLVRPDRGRACTSPAASASAACSSPSTRVPS